MGAFAWVTLATNDSYSLGALVLAHSLKQAGTAHQLAVLVTPGVTTAMREKLSSVFNVVQEVNILDSRDEANLRLLKRPELGITFTKLHCWRLTQFEKCVFLDADTLVLRNADELFEREELSAAPDVGWPDCFNSGVFVYRPSLDTYEKLIQFALEKGSFDGGDQGLLNLYFSDWAHKDISKHLPFIYNVCSTACYSYIPAFKQFGANTKIIHFIGAQKPWLQYFNTETRKVQPSGDSTHLQEVLQQWWDIFCSLIHPHLSPAMQGQSQHGINPSYVPPQYDPPTNPTASADDYENMWDPWDEYDQKVAQNAHYSLTSTHSNQNQPIESLNTNASRVADQPSIHSQPQPHNYNTYSVQNNSYYQPPPPQVVYQDVPRIPTPPPTPRPEHYHQPPEFHQPQQHHHSEPQPKQHHYHSEPQPQEHHYHSEPQHFQQSEPQPYHHESQSQHQEYNPQQFHNQNINPEHQSYHYEQQSHQENNHAQHQDYTQPQFDVHQQNESNEFIHHSSEQSSQKDEHIYTHESFSHTPERPGSPNRPDQIPLLPKEFEATTTVSNDMSLSSTIEDSSKHENAGLAGAFSQLTLGVARTPEQDAFENVLRKQAWEVGNIDYLGKDSFENIWSKISETLSSAPQPEVLAPVPGPEIPTAPAASQSQTAPQEEAIPVQLPVLPVDTPIPTTDVTKISSSESSPREEVQTENQQILQAALIIPSNEGISEPPQNITSTVVQAILPVSTPEGLSPVAPAQEVASAPESKVDVSQVATQEIVSEPAVQPVREPVVEGAIEPVAEQPLETIAAPAKEPAAESKVQPVVELTKKPAAEGTVEPVAEITSTSAVEPITEPVSEPLVCPIPPKKEVTPQIKSSEPKPDRVQEQVEISSKSQTVAPSEPLQPTQIVSAEPAKPPSSPEQKVPLSPSPSVPAGDSPSLASSTSDPIAAPVTPSLSATAELPKGPEPSAEPAVTTPAVETSKAPAPSAPKTSPKTKVTEATPPTTPATPPVEKTKPALTAEATVPDTPPPSEGGSTPTPPPRKTDKPKKVAAKQKK